MAKIKNILIFVSVAAAFTLIYVFFVEKKSQEGSLISTVPSAPAGAPIDASSTTIDSSITKEFLTLLLSVKGIHLDDAIFSDIAFTTLRDSSIVLIPDGTEGRPNPFAPIGTETAALPAPNSTAGANTASGPGSTTTTTTTKTPGQSTKTTSPGSSGSKLSN